MSINQSDAERLGRQVAASLHEHWMMFLIEGIILVILGAIAIIIPPLATQFVAALIGWLFLISGVVGFYMTFRLRQVPGFWWSLVSALLGVAAGLILLLRPVTGALSLTLVLIVFFILEGVASIMYGLDHRRELSGRWGWMVASGIIDLVLAAIIFAGLPETAEWAIGLLVGINLVFGGVAMIAMALHARDIDPNALTRPG
jgi:uncharacterized membrane protein HdeD (DUF308 family)